MAKKQQFSKQKILIHSSTFLLGYWYWSVQKHHVGIGMCHVLYDNFDFKSKYLFLDFHVCCFDAGEFWVYLDRKIFVMKFDCVFFKLIFFRFQINVCGLMEAWGLTIDLVSCIGLELAVGLCVDYAAHVGHTFLVTGPGTKHERALETITHIVPAVLYGGLSTLLAVSMLADSEAYTFQAFFKVLTCYINFHKCYWSRFWYDI